MSFDFKNASPEELKAKYKELAKKIGDDQFFTKKELNYLPEILKEGEQVLGFVTGLMGGNTWLVTLTDNRLIFLDKGMLWGLKQDIVPLSKVQSVSCSTGIIFGEIKIAHGSKTYKIENVIKGTVKIFTNMIQEQIDSINAAPAASATSSAATTDPEAGEDKYAKLEKLFALKEKGVLTEEEFEKEKKKILSE